MRRGNVEPQSSATEDSVRNGRSRSLQDVVDHQAAVESPQEEGEISKLFRGLMVVCELILGMNLWRRPALEKDQTGQT
jgi:hypothetical protein